MLLLSIFSLFWFRLSFITIGISMLQLSSHAAFCYRTCLPDLEKAGVIGLIEPINPWSLPLYNMSSFEDGLNLVK